jgi:hypothetical protein
VFDYDKALGDHVQAIIKAVDDLYSDSEANRWTDAVAKVRNIKNLLLDFESRWNNREKEFRPLEV